MERNRAGNVLVVISASSRGKLLEIHVNDRSRAVREAVDALKEVVEACGQLF